MNFKIFLEASSSPELVMKMYSGECMEGSDAFDLPESFDGGHEEYAEKKGQKAGKYIEGDVPHNGLLDYEFEAWHVRGCTLFQSSGERYNKGLLAVRGKVTPEQIAHDYYVICLTEEEDSGDEKTAELLRKVVLKLQQKIGKKPTRPIR